MFFFRFYDCRASFCCTSVRSSFCLCLATKQALKAKLYKDVKLDDFLVQSVVEIYKGKINLGYKRQPLLVVLSQLMHILPKSFWCLDVKKGAILDQGIDFIMKHCPEWRSQTKTEREKYSTIEKMAISSVRNYGRITEAEFAKMVDSLFVWI